MSTTTETIETAAPEMKTWGMLAEFDEPHTLLDAVPQVRDAGFVNWDVHTPFPVHGLDDAMGIKTTILPWIVLCGGLTGLAGATLMQWWMNAVDYQILISGKPYFSLPAFVPIMFEGTVLLSAITAFVSMLALNGLPQLYHPLFRSARFRRVTTDRFFIVIETRDPQYDEVKTREFLNGLGALSVETVEDEVR